MFVIFPGEIYEICYGMDVSWKSQYLMKPKAEYDIHFIYRQENYKL